MTLALTVSKPAARPFQLSYSTAVRPGIEKALVGVEPPAALSDDESVTSGTDQTIGLLEQVAGKMTEALSKLQGNEETLSALQQKLDQLQQEKDAAEDVGRRHAARATEMDRIAEELRTTQIYQAREYTRLKTNADRLLAIFATETATM